MRLALFTRPEILQQIGHLRLPMFFRAFAEDLKAANILLPLPPDPDDLRIPDPAPDSPQGVYFASVAAILSSPALLPDRLRAILFTLEEAASPENDARLQDAFQRRLPCLAVSPCALDRALDLWFAAPDELSQFALLVAPKSDEGGPAAPKSDEGGSPNIHQSNNPTIPATLPSFHSSTLPPFPSAEPWPDPVNGKLLLDQLLQILIRFGALHLWPTMLATVVGGGEFAIIQAG